MVAAYAVGGISGGAFNPAVAVSITFMHLVFGASLWIHLLTDLGGGVAAALASKALSVADRQACASPGLKRGRAVLHCVVPRFRL